MAALCFLLREEGGVKVQDAVRGCVVHDLAESVVGDITYKDGVDRGKKLERERDTLKFLQYQLLDDAPLMSSWVEFETAETPTGGIAKDLDKVDLAFQALDYEEKMKVQLPEFFHSALRVKFCGGLIEEILKTRKIGASAELDPEKRQKLDNYYGN
jgi:putative hydrolases of HD superfamily